VEGREKKKSEEKKTKKRGEGRLSILFGVHLLGKGGKGRVSEKKEEKGKREEKGRGGGEKRRGAKSRFFCSCLLRCHRQREGGGRRSKGKRKKAFS